LDARLSSVVAFPIRICNYRGRALLALRGKFSAVAKARAWKCNVLEIPSKTHPIASPNQCHPANCSSDFFSYPHDGCAIHSPRPSSRVALGKSFPTTHRAFLLVPMELAFNSHCTAANSAIPSSWLWQLWEPYLEARTWRRGEAVTRRPSKLPRSMHQAPTRRISSSMFRPSDIFRQRSSSDSVLFGILIVTLQEVYGASRGG